MSIEFSVHNLTDRTHTLERRDDHGHWHTVKILNPATHYQTPRYGRGSYMVLRDTMSSRLYAFTLGNGVYDNDIVTINQEGVSVSPLYL